MTLREKQLLSDTRTLKRFPTVESFCIYFLTIKLNRSVWFRPVSAIWSARRTMKNHWNGLPSVWTTYFSNHESGLVKLKKKKKLKIKQLRLYVTNAIMQNAVVNRERREKTRNKIQTRHKVKERKTNLRQRTECFEHCVRFAHNFVKPNSTLLTI